MTVSILWSSEKKHKNSPRGLKLSPQTLPYSYLKWYKILPLGNHDLFKKDYSRITFLQGGASEQKVSTEIQNVKKYTQAEEKF